MNVSITPELQQMVQRQVETGRYNNASEVVRDALRMFEQLQQRRAAELDAMRNVLDESIRELAAGDVVDGDEAITSLRGMIDAAATGV
jgi:antitoxin ParD1/3/4